MRNEDKKQKKSGITYYSIVAFSLAVIGSVSWFAATRSDNPGSAGEYPKKDSSYNSKVQSETPQITEKKEQNDAGGAESVAKPVESEPYVAPAPENGADSLFTMPVDGAVVKPYSRAGLQYSSTYGDMRLHEGIDISCTEGSAVKAAANGTVTDITDDPFYGKLVTIDHGGGLTVRYCGLAEIAVTAGQTVLSGDQIAFSGTVPCECADGPHVHIDAALDGESVSVFDILGAGQ